MSASAEPGSGWFEPPLDATTKIAVVDRRPSPVPRTPSPVEPSVVRPYVAGPVDDLAPQQLAPLQVQITAIHPDVLRDIATELRHQLLYAPVPEDGWHTQGYRQPGPLFDDRPAAGLLCPTTGCSLAAGHTPPCDQAAAGGEAEQDGASWH